MQKGAMAQLRSFFLLAILSLSASLTAQNLEDRFFFEPEEDSSESEDNSFDGFFWSMAAGFLETGAALYALEKGPGFISRWAADDVVPFATIFSIFGGAFGGIASAIIESDHSPFWTAATNGALGALFTLSTMATFMRCAHLCSPPKRRQNRYAVIPLPMPGNPGTIVAVPPV